MFQIWHRRHLISEKKKLFNLSNLHNTSVTLFMYISIDYKCVYGKMSPKHTNLRYVRNALTLLTITDFDFIHIHEHT